MIWKSCLFTTKGYLASLSSFPYSFSLFSVPIVVLKLNYGLGFLICFVDFFFFPGHLKTLMMLINTWFDE